MIVLQKANLNFLDRIVFRDIDCLIPDKSRIGLVGENGAGKTTLLRVIRGETELQSGTLEISKNSTIGYLPQDLEELEALPLLVFLQHKTGIVALEQELHRLEHEVADTVPDSSEHQAALRSYATVSEQFRLKEVFSFEARARRVVFGLGFKETDLQKNCRDFSGGWKMRISLAALLLQQPDIMLLDEPTNHLDTESIEWLENFLKNYTGTMITVSHDHLFLDKMVSRIAELHHGRLHLFKGNYSYYLKEKAQQMELLKKEQELQKSEIKRAEVFIERFRSKATKAKQVQSRIKMLEKFAPIELEANSKSVAIHFPECQKSGKEVIVASGIKKQYGTQIVLREITFTIERGEKVALVGVNGAGKSTLSRLLSGVEAPESGTISQGLHVKLGFFSQESAQNLNYQHTIIDELDALHTKANDQVKRNLLGTFLFSGSDVYKKIAILSGGEKSRLALLKLLLQDTNCLILDEPTNHLDIRTKHIFQNALLAYNGTVIIVSHDRYFLDHLVSRVFEIRHGSVYDYSGNYSYFIEKRGNLEEILAGPTVAPAHAAASQAGIKTKAERREIVAERNRQTQRQRELGKELKRVEMEMAHLDMRRSSNDKLLCDPDVFKDAEKIKPLLGEQKTIAQRQQELLPYWEKLLTELEALAKDK